MSKGIFEGFLNRSPKNVKVSFWGEPMECYDTIKCLEQYSNRGPGRSECDVFKSFCLALGIFILLVGAECLCVQRFVMKIEQPAETSASEQGATSNSSQKIQKPLEFSPSKPMAWSLIAVGGFLTLNTLLKK